MSERRQYPAGGNIVESWEAMEEEGRGILEVAGSDVPVVVTWRAYRNPDGSYTSSTYGIQYIGIFERGGHVFRVTETYTNTSITNSGRRIRRFRRTSADGVCCTEIVRALIDGRRLVLEKVEKGRDRGRVRLEVEQARDHTFHEIDIERFRCEAVLDLGARTAILRRSRLRDASQ